MPSPTLPESHRWPEAYCPKVAYDEFVAGLELPVVDLHQDEQTCLEKLGRACREWGFFQLVNHGVPPYLISEMEDISCSFFSLSHNEKIIVTEEGTKFHKLYDSMTRKRYTACSWVEGLNIHDKNAILHIASKAWPERASKICATFSSYLQEMDKLGKSLLRLLVLSLGVQESSARDMLTGCGFTGTRFNYYPTCPDPLLTLGVVPHSDPNCVTILHQDEVGGLQVSKDGKWIGVKPIKNAFVINIGDSFQAWSNCKYKSIEHRAVVNTQQPRFSIAFFYGPTKDFTIQPPNELIDEEHPPSYRPFFFKDYLAWRKESNVFGKNAFDSFVGANPRFAVWSSWPRCLSPGNVGQMLDTDPRIRRLAPDRRFLRVRLRLAELRRGSR